MATVGTNRLTYRDLMSGLTGKKTFDHEIVDLVMQENDILDDLVITEANDGSSNKTTIRTGLPEVAWVGFYEGVQASKGSKAQIRNVAGHMKSKLEIDADLYDAAPDKSALLLDEIGGHVEAMGQELADCLFYGKVSMEPKKFNGLINFYSELGGALSTDNTLAKHYVFDGKSTTQASTAALRSIFLIGWGQKAIRCFYPQGSATGGLKRGEFKKVDVVNADDATKTYEAYRQYLSWQLGLDVRDYRYGGRLANIQADEMFDTTGIPNYVELLDRLSSRVKSKGVNQAFYMDPLVWEAVKTWFSRATRANAFSFEQIEARKTPTLFGIPVRTCQALAANETAVA